MKMQKTEKQIREAYKNLTLLLIENGISITTMESATSGQIASLITDTEGASAIFKGAYVTYSNETKIQAGVSSDIIEKYSVYSEETARDMAAVCRKAFGADIGIGVTGTTGNVDPENEDFSTPGRLYFAIDYDIDVIKDPIEKNQKGTVSCVVDIPVQSNRLMYKLVAAYEIYGKLMELLSFTNK